MKIFISWSGNTSKKVAKLLCQWLQKVLQISEPWISTEIEKGRRWSLEISKNLKESKIAIICLTKDNLNSNWIHFETGAIANSSDAIICTFLYNITSANINPPLSDFQSTSNSKTEMYGLVSAINKKIGSVENKSLPEEILKDIFNTYWPQLKNDLDNIAVSKEENTVPLRTDREILEEILDRIRRSTKPEIDNIDGWDLDNEKPLIEMLQWFQDDYRIELKKSNLIENASKIIKYYLDEEFSPEHLELIKKIGELIENKKLTRNKI